MSGQIVKTGHLSIEGATPFFEALARRITEYQSEGLVVEVQYQAAMQLNGIALFSAVILGRK